MIFTHGRMVYMILRKPVVCNKNKKYALYLYCFGFRFTEHFIFLLFWTTRNKFLNFLLQFWGPNYMLLLLIIIEQNIILTKSSVNRKKLVLRTYSGWKTKQKFKQGYHTVYVSSQLSVRKRELSSAAFGVFWDGGFCHLVLSPPVFFRRVHFPENNV